MSGNPFRRAPSHPVAPISTSDSTAASSSGQASGQQPLYSQPNATPTRPRSESKTKKTVRIRSPEFSPIAADYTRSSPLPDYRTAVPLPPPTAFRSSPPAPLEASEETSFDPFEARFPPLTGLSDGGDDQVSQNTRRNSGHAGPGEGERTSTLSNPFSTTLATMEAGIASVVPDPQEKLKLAKLDDAVPPKAGKVAMDVDSFTRMLMTGNTAIPKPDTEFQATAPTIDSGSSTDVSLLSRQSMPDALQRPLVESPRTSFDEPFNVDNDRGNEDSSDEGVSTAPHIPSAVPEKPRQPPPPPKHRHGKSVSTRGPQTVSFDDFTASLKQNLPSAAQKDGADEASRPLPALPGPVDPDATTAVDLHREKTPTQASVAPLAEPAEVVTRSLSQKKAPPPVPLARRQSQMRSRGQNRPRSNSAMTVESQESASYPPSIAESTSSSKMLPPPPPPTRRYGSHGSGTASVVDVPGSAVPRSALSQALTSSQHSSQSNLSSSPPAPPPPRRRRRSSGRNSIDNTRSSGEYGRGSFDSTRRSMESARSLSTPAEEVVQSDVLADMDAFQREIDELRKAQDGR